ncbi:MAG: tRNA pseudouridine(38-40) synthase TruA [Candidatus Methanoperedens sp.]|nr:tRNA pseudouridine(38-40) synthase TruA [Candidatus Methanoperedens sp.]MCZ7360619.1 tRNA pseudouridine(38-40) synthase TruA [Candidatus Methanoperedens sp.]HLB71962.1 tRNA pseudouridine(38-40) synthase TruA [Candidatus Methanoperedens sp.]
MRIALKLAYLGTEYYGFQTQPGVPTIEGKLLKAMKELGALKNPSKARYSAAGRTDRGVHALGQVIAFDSENPDASAPRALNSKLTHIWAYAWAEVNSDFNARKSAQEREYRYMQWGEGLDFDKIKDAASIFSGSHDFRNFATPEPGKPTACDIRKISIQKHGEWIYLDIVANRFIWHMVRKIATALKLIGKGEKDRDWLERMLDCSISDRLEPQGPHGLILMDVRYPGIKWTIDRYARNRVLEEMHELFINHEITAKMLKEMENGMQE